MKRIFAISWLLMSALFFTACGSAPASEADFSMASRQDVLGEAAPAEPMAADSDSANLALPDAQIEQVRIIIYTGNVELIVTDTNQSVLAITQIADEMGGFVADANIYHTDDIARGSMTIRVPAEAYQQTLQRLRDISVRVERESSSSQDVTEEFVDLEARKANLERTETALQELLETRQKTGRTEDILEVHRELTNVRGQIEQIQGRLNYLSRSAALSTITIQLTPDALAQPITVAGWEPQGVAKEALQALINAFQSFVDFWIWAIIFLLPILILYLIPIIIIVWLIRKAWRFFRGRRKKKTPPPEAQADSEASEAEESKETEKA